MKRWTKTLDVSDIFRGEQPFTERRDLMVERIRRLDEDDCDGELQDIADALGDARDVDDWDKSWDWFYDWADSNAVWVRTR